MKNYKIVYLPLIFILGLLVSYFCFVTFSKNNNYNVFANSYISLNNDNFYQQLNENPSGSFQLTQDIILNDWTPINFSGVLDGNGYTISTNKQLFININNSKIFDLAIETIDTIVYNAKDNFANTNFGILAQSAYNSDFSSISINGSVSVSAKSSIAVGSLFGFAQSSVISNCYSNTNLKVIQSSSEALQTVVGGLVGQSVACKIYNCYTVPLIDEIINVNVLNNLNQPKTDLIIGGFIGFVEKSSVGLVSNCFCGGNINFNYTQDESNKNTYIGKIFGQVSGFSSLDNSLSYVYTYNSSNFDFIGKTNNVVFNCFQQKDIALFGERSNFETYNNENLQWNVIYQWNLTDIWTKNNNSSFLVLQVFEFFTINLDQTLNDEGISSSLLILQNEQYIQTNELKFKYGEKLRISLAITPEFSNYKIVQSLIKTDSNDSLVLNYQNNRNSAYFDFIVNAQTAGLYYATAESIEYSLIVKTENIEHGFVKYGTSSTNQEKITYSVVYGGEYTFVADPIDSSFAFGGWYWVDYKDDGSFETILATRGEVDSGLLANRSITIAFGEQGTSASVTYLGLGEGFNIPYQVGQDGKVTFTIQAGFTQNVANLKIISNLDADAFNLYVGGVLVSNVVDFINLYDSSIQIGRPILISVEMKEGYIFDGWSASSGLSLDDKLAEGESSKSTSINLTINNDFVLEVSAHAEVDPVTSLLWLWILLGCLGAGGLITLIVIFSVRAKRRRSFINNY